MERVYWVRGIRGATTVKADEPSLVHEATQDLLNEMLLANNINDHEIIASIFFQCEI